MQADEIFPFLLGFVIFAIPIVAILANHQRRMTELIHGSRGADPQVLQQLDAIRRELAELKHVVYQSVIAADERKGSLLSSSDAPSRLGQA